MMVDAEHNQVGSIDHCPVSCLKGCLKVAPSCGFANLYLVVICVVVFRVVAVFGCEIGQYPDMCAVVAAVFPLATPYGGGNKLIKLPIPPNQELDILMFPKQGSYKSFQPASYFQCIYDHAMPKETDGKCIQHPIPQQFAYLCLSLKLYDTKD